MNLFKEYVFDGKYGWRVVVSPMADGEAYVGAGPDENEVRGAYLSGEQLDDLIFRLVKIRRQHRKQLNGNG
jgi:hypothetical protein